MKLFTIFWGDEPPRELDEWPKGTRFVTPDGSFIYASTKAFGVSHWFTLRAGDLKAIPAEAVPAKYRTQLLLLI